MYYKLIIPFRNQHCMCSSLHICITTTVSACLSSVPPAAGDGPADEDARKSTQIPNAAFKRCRRGNRVFFSGIYLLDQKRKVSQYGVLLFFRS